eukprot:SAG11_NODE_20627_length_441_cov_1.210526_1_plen_48_part_01
MGDWMGKKLGRKVRALFDTWLDVDSHYSNRSMDSEIPLSNIPKQIPTY